VRTTHAKLAAGLCFALTAFTLAGCTHAQRGEAETAVAKALISDDQEAQLGAQVKQQLEQQQHVKYLDDREVVSFVNGITGKILPLAEKDRPGVKWQVHVIDDPKTVNAFATPGGYLYVYSGLLLAAGDPAEVAGVLSHEAGHVVARHSARQMVDALGLEAVTALALGKNPSALSQVVASAGGTGLMLANSREDETEADEYGARYASAAGYDPKGLITFFDKLRKLEGQQPGFAKFLSDHPATPDRIAHLKQYIAEHHLSGSAGRDPAELAAVKGKVPKAAGAPPGA
jgi:predicted Zn-dependent protease